MTKREQQKRLKAITREVNAIFREHGVDPEPGDEGFWEAVNEVAYKLNPTVKRLYDLGREWDTIQFSSPGQ